MRAIVLKLRDYWPSVVLIAAIGGGAAALAVTQQSSDPAPRDAVAAAASNRTLAGSPGSYVDCRRLGHAVSVGARAGDVDASGDPRVAARFGSVDLTRVTVAVAGTMLCADFTSVAPPNASTFYSLFLSRNAPNSASVRIDAGLRSLGQRVLLRYPGDEEAANHGIVPARVGVAGSSTSFLIDRGVLPRFAPFPRFLWSAEAVGQTGLMSPQQVSDYAPDGYQPAYP